MAEDAAANTGETTVELEPRQPAAVSAAVAGLLAGERPDGTAAWWQAGIADALASGVEPPAPVSAPVQRGVGAAPLRKSRGTDRA